MEALKGKPNTTFAVPSGIVQASVDKVSGYRSHDGFPSRGEYFIKGTEPGEDPIHVKLKVCKSDGKLATPSDISAGNYEEREFFVFKEEDPTAKRGEENKWQKGILEWLQTQTDSKYHPPEDYCGGISNNPINVEFINPTDKASNLPNKFTIKATADSTADIIQIELEVDGEKIRTFTGPPYEQEVELEDGVHNLRAKAKDENNNESDRKITIGVNVEWDSE